MIQTTQEWKTWLKAGRFWISITDQTLLNFEAQVDRGAGNDGCHPWRGPINGDGYGTLSVIIQNKGWTNIGAHRLAYLIECGDIPTNLSVCHSCDNPPCVNVSHLFLGTPQDNIDDMILKGRGVGRSGSIKTGRFKIDELDVLTILDLYYNTGDHTYKSLAGLFGVSTHIIERIVRRELWSELPFQPAFGNT